MDKDREFPELSQKYCPHLESNVTMMSENGETACLSSHLCREDRRIVCDHYMSSRPVGEEQKRI